MDMEGYFTKSDLLDYMKASTKAISHLTNVLNMYCANKSFSWMMADRIKSLESINGKISRKKREKGDDFDPKLDLMDIAGLRIVFYDRNTTFPNIEDLSDSNCEKNPMDIIDEKIHKMDAREFELEFEKSKIYDGNYNVSNLYDFVDTLARTWNRVIIIKDYIMYQKPSGYQSLHVIINIPIETTDSENNIVVRDCPVEIQFRNYTQHLYNECEHDVRYKANRHDASEFEVAFDNSKNFLLNCSNEAISSILSSDKQYLLVRNF